MFATQRIVGAAIAAFVGLVLLYATDGHARIAVAQPVSTPQSPQTPKATPTPYPFGLILLEKQAVTFRLTATVNINYSPTDGSGKLTCHRISVTEADPHNVNHDRAIELWFDAGVSTSGIVLPAQTVVRSILCAELPSRKLARLYITGTVPGSDTALTPDSVYTISP